MEGDGVVPDAHAAESNSKQNNNCEFCNVGIRSNDVKGSLPKCSVAIHQKYFENIATVCCVDRCNWKCKSYHFKEQDDSIKLQERK